MNRARLAVMVISVLVVFGAISRRAGAEELLREATRQSARVGNAAALTDGEEATPGGLWNGDVVATLRGTEAFVEFDLGQVKPIRAAYLQADNNDDYLVQTSLDGSVYTPLWKVPTTTESGLRARFISTLTAEGRFVRISASGGDGAYGVSELMVFSEVPRPFPPSPVQKLGLDPSTRFRTALLTFAAAVAVFLLGAYRGARVWALLFLALVPLVALYGLAHALYGAWPPAARDVAMVRAVAAAIAGLALLREVLPWSRFRVHPAATVSALTVSASLAIAAFYNLGHPQFWDHARARPGFIHATDMRVYYPVAKYFRELRFDGVYLASVKAYLDDQPSIKPRSLDRVVLRDLKTHRVTDVRSARSDMEAVKERFTAERWAAFVTDMRYFRENLGQRDYLGTLTDHGGNATPVWIALAHLLFNWLPASRAVLTVGGLLDPLLLLGLCVAVWRAFGLRTMLLSMTVFGANDFYMFGSNWAGATLRHDWMAYLGFGICAVRLKHWWVGGALLGMATMIRAFPVLAFAGVVFLLLWFWFEERRALGHFPRLREVWAAQKPAFRVLAGGFAAMAVSFLFSSLLFSFSVWTEWLHKVTLLDREVHLNHISLRGLIAGNDHDFARLLLTRLPVFLAALLACVSMVALVCRGRPLYQAVLLALGLIPVVFNPANYYIHFVFLLPLLAVPSMPGILGSEHPNHLVISGPLLFVCVAQYWVALDTSMANHFQYSNALLFLALGTIYVWMLRQPRHKALPKRVVEVELLHPASAAE